MSILTRIHRKPPGLSVKKPQGTAVTLDITFAPKNKIIVECQRPFRTKDGGFEMRSWIGVCSKFEPLTLTSTSSTGATTTTLVQVPMHMEAGWKRSEQRDDVFYYFIGDNHDLVADTEGPTLSLSSNEKPTASLHIDTTIASQE